MAATGTAKTTVRHRQARVMTGGPKGLPRGQTRPRDKVPLAKDRTPAIATRCGGRRTDRPGTGRRDMPPPTAR